MTNSTLSMLKHLTYGININLQCAISASTVHTGFILDIFSSVVHFCDGFHTSKSTPLHLSGLSTYFVYSSLSPQIVDLQTLSLLSWFCGTVHAPVNGVNKKFLITDSEAFVTFVLQMPLSIWNDWASLLNVLLLQGEIPGWVAMRDLKQRVSSCHSWCLVFWTSTNFSIELKFTRGKCINMRTVTPRFLQSWRKKGETKPWVKNSGVLCSFRRKSTGLQILKYPGVQE